MTDEQKDKVYEQIMKDISRATPGERALLGALNLIYDELCLLRESNSMLQEQFDKVSAGGNALLTEVC